MAVESFNSALAAAQSKEKFSAAVQTAAGKVNADALKAAVDAVLAGGDDASVSDADQSAALKSGFEFATELVKALQKEPGTDDKLKVRLGCLEYLIAAVPSLISSFPGIGKVRWIALVWKC
jgi:hypothetical protein